MATLKISDLSVGDWVALEGADLKIEHGDIATAFVEEVRKPICVQSILGEDRSVFARAYHLDGYGMIYTKEEYLRPIPITPEILEANGWKRDGSEYKWSNEKHRVFVWLKKSSYGVDVVEMDKQFATKYSCIEVSQLYVHLLQHALRLAGVDKEIVMPNK